MKIIATLKTESKSELADDKGVAYAPFGRLATPIKYYVRSKIIMKIIATLKTESKSELADD